MRGVRSLSSVKMRARTGKVVMEITTHMKMRNRAKSTSLVPATILPRIRSRPMSKTKGRDISPMVNNSICIEKFSDFPQLGRFTLRTEDQQHEEYFFTNTNELQSAKEDVVKKLSELSIAYKDDVVKKLSELSIAYKDDAMKKFYTSKVNTS
ncbi:hypothetical protein JHK87_027952 [Glycine soja]|nr:hypothetical protein JHK87_027952 [Glycine soja]